MHEDPRAALIHQLGVPVIRASIPVDQVFGGVGANRKPIQIGVEIKKPGDLASCINDGRLVQQIRNGIDYGLDLIYLFVIGNPGAAPKSKHWVQNGKSLHIDFSRVEGFLNSLELKYNVHVKYPRDEWTMANMSVELWRWLQKPPEEHNSVDDFYRPIPMVGGKISLLRRIAKELPRVGWDRSLKVERSFDTVIDMMQASKSTWEDVPGIGKGIAGAIYKDLRTPGA